MNRKGRRGAGAHGRRGFTLAELMVAVVVLLVVILATSRLFNTASTVAGYGEANNDILQDAAAIERQLREDIAQIDYDGFLVVRCVQVRNDVNATQMLNPALPPGALLRCDQLYFFTSGPQQMVTFGELGSNIKGMGTAARVYWGHAVQLPGGLPVEGNPTAYVRAQDIEINLSTPLVPWSSGTFPRVRTVYRHNNPAGSPAEYSATNDGAGTPQGGWPAVQPPATRWVVARHAVVLADDGGAASVYLDQNRTAYFVDSAPVFQGRVDGAAEDLSDIRRRIELDSTGSLRPWVDPGNLLGLTDQRSQIVLMTGRSGPRWPVYMRAEREAPSMHRVDQALTNHIIGTWCSSFAVDWTWAPGTGEVRNVAGGIAVAPDGTVLTGMLTNADVNVAPAYREHPWFGLERPDRGVHYYATDGYPWWQRAATIDPVNVEHLIVDPSQFANSGRGLYEAVFGFNQTRPLNAAGNPDSTMGYTPWPTALRITMVLHDASGRIAQGREFQFVVPLPRRR